MLLNAFFEIIIFAGIVLLLKKPLVGIALVLLGTALFVLIRRGRKAAPERAEPTGSKTYRIARINSCEQELMAFAEEREEYEYSPETIVEKGLADDEIFRYRFPHFGELAEDPGNEHDKNAVMVLMNGECNGFIPAEDAVEVRRILETKRVVETILDIDGGPFKRFDSDTGEITVDTAPFHGEVSIVFEL